MDLDTLTAAGCYVVAGHIDHYNGKSHVRVGSVGLDGSVEFTRDGRAYADALLAAEYLNILGAPPEPIKPAKAGKSAKAQKSVEPPVDLTIPPAPAGNVLDGLTDLDDLLPPAQ